MDAKRLARSVDRGVLSNPWVSRAGNAAFVGGIIVGGVRLAKGTDPVTVLTVVLLAVGVILMAAPWIRRLIASEPSAQSAPSIGPSPFPRSKLERAILESLNPDFRS